MRDACQNGGVPEELKQAMSDIKDAMEYVKHKVLVLSGKGGVGKSTVTYLLAKLLSKSQKVSVCDLDLCGPSMPYLFNVPICPLHETSFGFEPSYAGHNMGLVSTAFFLEHDDAPVIARGPRKNALIMQFLKDVDWGDTEVLLVDTPPGTSDEHMSVVSFMKEAGIDGAVIVTTPEEVALSDVRREVKFCERAGVRVLGVVENMALFTCPKCGKDSSLYPTTTGGAQAMCDAMGLNLLGRIPVDPMLVAGLTGEKHEIPAPVVGAVDSIVKNLAKVMTLSNPDPTE